MNVAKKTLNLGLLGLGKHYYHNSKIFTYSILVDMLSVFSFKLDHENFIFG